MEGAKFQFQLRVQTFTRRQLEEMILKSLSNETRDYMQRVLGEKIGQYDDNLHAILRNGVLLCNLINKIVPGSIPRIHAVNSAPFQQRENIFFFINACKKLRVPNAALFTVEDLYSAKKLKNVFVCVHALATIANKNKFPIAWNYTDRKNAAACAAVLPFSEEEVEKITWSEFTVAEDAVEVIVEPPPAPVEPEEPEEPEEPKPEEPKQEEPKQEEPTAEEQPRPEEKKEKENEEKPAAEEPKTEQQPNPQPSLVFDPAAIAAELQFDDDAYAEYYADQPAPTAPAPAPVAAPPPPSVPTADAAAAAYDTSSSGYSGYDDYSLEEYEIPPPAAPADVQPPPADVQPPPADVEQNQSTDVVQPPALTPQEKQQRRQTVVPQLNALLFPKFEGAMDGTTGTAADGTPLLPSVSAASSETVMASLPTVGLCSLPPPPPPPDVPPPIIAPPATSSPPPLPPPAGSPLSRGNRRTRYAVVDRTTQRLPALHVAVLQGNLAKVEQLVKDGANLSEKTSSGDTVMHLAVQQPDAAVINFLIRNHAVMDLKNQEGNTPLHYAVAEGRVGYVGLMIKNGAKLSAPDKNGNPCLHLAVLCGMPPEMVRFMLKSGADSLVKNTEGKTAPQIALELEDVELVEVFSKFMLEKGLIMEPLVVPGAPPKKPKACASGPTTAEERFQGIANQIAGSELAGKITPLHVAVQFPNTDDVVDFILSRPDVKDLINAVDETGNAPLHTAIMHNNITAVKKLLAAGANIDAQNHAGDVPLHLAVQYGDPAIVSLLVHSKANLDLRNNDGNTPMHLAIVEGTEVTAAALAAQGARLDIKDAEGNTALHLACNAGYSAATIALMLQKSAKPTLENNLGETALAAAVQNCDAEVVRLLVGKMDKEAINKANLNGDAPIHIAAARGDCDVVLALVQAGADVNAKNAENCTVLQLAVEKDNTEVVKIVASAAEGIVDINAKTNEGWTPLYTACFRGNLAAVEALTKCGANPNMQNQLGWSPLHAACANGHFDAVRTLLGLQAVINIQDNQGTTPLYHACDNEREELAHFLIGLPGTDVNLGKKKGWRPLHACCRRGLADLVGQILARGSVDVNAPVEECQMYAPLHIAVMSSRNKNAGILRLLVDAGADVNQPTATGMTPLHLACSANLRTFAEYLVSVPKINLKAKNKNGRTALQVACYFGLEELVVFLAQKMGKKTIPKLEKHALKQQSMYTVVPEAPPPPDQF
eukprot:TRINITY_DN1120_c0_g1_i1.p1 TRINITY_DN1120_c0_g1~~TRINITY_DN1120_c0_g1_i1.p1  ORF type:complete len:1221 (-),score=409.90 TRINITY_DN1120_c0_g1_i1:38-3700(-)